ncbi:subtilase [bacterium]|nr:subtilase [bacterium]
MKIAIRSVASVLAIAAASTLGFLGKAHGSRTPKQIALTEDGYPYVRGEYLVKVRSSAALERLLESQYETIGAVARKSPVMSANNGTWYKVNLADDYKLRDAILSARESADVLYAEPNYVYYTSNEPEKNIPMPGNKGKGGPDYQEAPALPVPPVEDPQVSGMYGLNKIGAPQAWQIINGSAKVLVADIDTGIDYNHQDLINNIWHNPGEIPGDGIDNDGNGYIDDVVGWDFRDKDARPFDDNSHGSHTAGTIAATGGNGIGVSGVAQQASIMSLRFLGGTQGSGTLEDAIKAIEYATDNGAQIMSNSWGGGGFSQAMFDAISRANDKGILFVAAAGNSGTDNDKQAQYPANYELPNVLSVAATDSADKLASFSCFGLKTVHLAAPGVKIISTIPGNQYQALSGTSMATPHVTGAAVLLKAAYPNLKAKELKALLMDSVEKIPGLNGKVSTSGRLNISKAFAIARANFGEAKTGN